MVTNDSDIAESMRLVIVGNYPQDDYFDSKKVPVPGQRNCKKIRQRYVK